ncbi:hypothetical protein ARAF_0774 [Arsenophonus endosymbiont of Aleurodicus floccissimus]|uniref:tail fiber protein n=1 Tax=Arsenophonus endosymbiont of Aleurodicus floccissimus TaxID=2152761 RepID=UPI000E6AFC13|nr:phage tail protein [Arsenophonus endosymbiont of Aleurodicus floccissimus]SPP31632.1 hypothetical protein ARAF_0774 [Arsenophonus endosymbiont of Aleurodicus floccissimus]
MIAYVVAQFIAETNNSDVLDDGHVDKLKAGLISALSKNVNNTVPAATKTVAGITKLSSAKNSDDETQAATPKAVKAAYDLAKTVSIDEINKKLDKASVLQTTGNATDKVISQKADAKGNNKAVVTIPSNKNGTLALTSDVEAINNYPVGAPLFPGHTKLHRQAI